MLEEHGNVLGESLQLLGEEDPLEEEKRDRHVSILSTDLKESLQQESHRSLRNLDYTFYQYIMDESKEDVDFD